MSICESPEGMAMRIESLRKRVADRDATIERLERGMIMGDYTEIRDERIRGVICRLMSEMLDNPDEHGIYPTSRFMWKMKSFVLDEIASGRRILEPSRLEEELLGKDCEGNPIKNGDIVEHDNGLRPIGYFQVEIDGGEHGFVLGGVGKDADRWLREWSSDRVRVLSGAERKAALDAQEEKE